MQRRDFLILIGAAGSIALAAPAMASDPTEVLRAQLRAEGYRDLSEHRTLLGRIRINARRGNQLREVVVDPRTGEILRDLTRSIAEGSDGTGGSGSGSSGSGSSGSGNSGSDDGGSDDGGSDDGGSGSGSHDSGSDSGSDDGGSDGGSGDGGHDD